MDEKLILEEKEKTNLNKFENNVENLIVNDVSINNTENYIKTDIEKINIKEKNNSLQYELNETKKKLLTMSEVISELKNQLLSKNEYIEKNIIDY